MYLLTSYISRRLGPYFKTLFLNNDQIVDSLPNLLFITFNLLALMYLILLEESWSRAENAFWKDLVLKVSTNFLIMLMLWKEQSPTTSSLLMLLFQFVIIIFTVIFFINYRYKWSRTKNYQKQLCSPRLFS